MSGREASEYTDAELVEAMEGATYWRVFFTVVSALLMVPAVFVAWPWAFAAVFAYFVGWLGRQVGVAAALELKRRQDGAK